MGRLGIILLLGAVAFVVLGADGCDLDTNCRSETKCDADGNCESWLECD